MQQIIDMSRVGDFVPLRLQTAPVVVIGCGTTGSWVAHDLLRFGFTNVTVIDDDVVESHNIPAQFHVPDMIDRPKVDSFKTAMKRLKLPVPRMTIGQRFPIVDRVRGWRDLPFNSYVWSCVDTVHGRTEIATRARDRSVPMFIDLRMGPESGTMLVTGRRGPMTWDAYFESLGVEFAPEDACGRRAYVTTAKVLTGLAVHHWIQAEGSRITAEDNIALGIDPPRIVRMRPRFRVDLKGLMIVEEA